MKAAADDLTDEDTPLLIEALEDAIEYRLPDNGHCADCTYDEMCEDHTADQVKADCYALLLDKIRPMTNFIAVKRRWGDQT